MELSHFHDSGIMTSFESSQAESFRRDKVLSPELGGREQMIVQMRNEIKERKHAMLAVQATAEMRFAQKNKTKMMEKPSFKIMPNVDGMNFCEIEFQLANRQTWVKTCRGLKGTKQVPRF